MKLFVLAGILYIKKILTVRFSFLTYTFNFSTNKFIKKHVVLLVCME